MTKRICGVALGLWMLAVSASAQAQPTVGTLCQSTPGVWTPCEPGGGGSFNGLLLDAASGDPVTDTVNDALRVNVVAGSASGTTDADDASIAAGQTGLGLNASLSMAFDGTVWRRLTFGTAGTASAQVLTIQGVASMTPVQVSQATAASLNATVVGTGTFATQVDGAALTALQLIDNIPITIGSTTSGQSGALVMGAVTTSAPTYTTAQSHPLSLDTTGSLRVAITSGAGSGGTALADDADFTAGTTSFTPFGGFYQSTVTACTDGDACAARVTAGRAVTVALVNPDGSAATYATDVVEDAAETAGGSGPMVMSVRRDTAASSAGTTGDNATINTDASGRLWTNPGTIGVEDAAETAGGGLAMAGAVVRSSAAGSTATAGDNATINVDTLGRLWVRPGNPCEDHARVQSAAISNSTSGNVEVVALNGSDLIYVCGYSLVAGAATGVRFVYGTGTACATGETGLTGAWSFAANGGITQGNAGAPQFVVPAGNAFCTENSGANSIQGHVTYVRTAAP